MNIKNIKAALAKQAQILGVSPVVIATTPKTASTLNTPVTVTAATKTHTTDSATLSTIPADTVTKASPTVTPNISTIP